MSDKDYKEMLIASIVFTVFLIITVHVSSVFCLAINDKIQDYQDKHIQVAIEKVN